MVHLLYNINQLLEAALLSAFYYPPPLYCSVGISPLCCHVRHQLRAALAIMGCKSLKNISAIQS